MTDDSREDFNHRPFVIAAGFDLKLSKDGTHLAAHLFDENGNYLIHPLHQGLRATITVAQIRKEDPDILFFRRNSEAKQIINILSDLEIEEFIESDSQSYATPGKYYLTRR